MDFGAYLASSSSEGSGDEGEGPSMRGQEAAAYGGDRIQKYKVPSHAWCVVLRLVAAAVFVLCICRHCLRDAKRTKVRVVLKKRWRSHGSQVVSDVMMITLQIHDDLEPP